jgi:hypothetical protein
VAAFDKVYDRFMEHRASITRKGPKTVSPEEMRQILDDVLETL